MSTSNDDFRPSYCLSTAAFLLTSVPLASVTHLRNSSGTNGRGVCKEHSMCGHFKKANAQQKQSNNLYSPTGQSLEKLVECLLAAWILLDSYWRSSWENNTGLCTKPTAKYPQTILSKSLFIPQKRCKENRRPDTKLNSKRLKERKRAKDKCEREREGKSLFSRFFIFISNKLCQYRHFLIDTSFQKLAFWCLMLECCTKLDFF